ncbi:phenylacetate-CoA oxygenase/reductase, PaaK subunit [Luminiphilus syltensis NOR5-1B]|uniref:Phenylacetate-CoA oxygenase/reductase, PaaK subunit n=1 Tax=Luminiphilus syltensis NOR5-1B TaxID=565045 RepID=B8KT77_9GAMM|nr:2Fe-2S iron-sulfur cluster-binding protein [Luminiphilus syltensis]EED36290.1 phenylacetate-CoA oxygenase/reductase, PaaK subunit [Luminiphilus syltensis NOR5-1B]
MATYNTLTVSQVTPETDSAVCVSFDVPESLRDVYNFKPGQYLTLKAEIDGESVSRSYSICVPPGHDQLQVAIKRVEGGIFSNFANDHLEAGHEIEVMAPDGHFSVETDPDTARKYLFISAGSGITPVMSNVEAILENEPNSTVTLLYGNQRTGSIMFRQKLAFLKNKYLDRLNWVNILSREEQEAPILNGRLDNKKGAELNQRLINLKHFDLFLLCGPESMISEVSRGLRGLGIEESRILYELFGSSAEDAAERVARHHARSEAFAGKMCKVTIVNDGRANQVDIAADGENLLDAGLNLGIDLPYACKGGVCSTCKALLIEGEVEMDIQRGLTDEEVANNMILTCQSHPISDKVVVDFDKRFAGD